jgi:hypothetical protein
VLGDVGEPHLIDAFGAGGALDEIVVDRRPRRLPLRVVLPNTLHHP